mmetsp:Transcript_32360/g.82121  ORF Transcript_32360/g.82121 Transcript_32360/m.82121 type:complete len:420 (-) Transcript_32360:154-1413(-)
MFRSGRSRTLTLTLARSVPKRLDVSDWLQYVPGRAASDRVPASSTRESVRTCSTGAKPRVPRPGQSACDHPAAGHFNCPLARDRDYGKKAHPYASRLPRRQGQGSPSAGTHAEVGHTGDEGFGGGSQEDHEGKEDSHDQPHTKSPDSKLPPQAPPPHQASDQGSLQDSMLDAESITDSFATCFDDFPNTKVSMLLNLRGLASGVFGKLDKTEPELNDKERWKMFHEEVAMVWLDGSIEVEKLDVSVDELTKAYFRDEVSRITRLCLESSILEIVFPQGPTSRLPFKSTFKILLNERHSGWAELLSQQAAGICAQSKKEFVSNEVHDVLRALLETIEQKATAKKKAPVDESKKWCPFLPGSKSQSRRTCHGIVEEVAPHKAPRDGLSGKWANEKGLRERVIDTTYPSRGTSSFGAHRPLK